MVVFLPHDALWCKVRYCDCMSSVCLSVCDVGGSGPHKLEILELIAWTISPTPLLFVAQTPSTYSQGNIRKFGGDYRWGGKTWWAGAQKEQYLWNTWRYMKSYYGVSIGTHRCSFKRYHTDPLWPPVPQDWGFATLTQNSSHCCFRNGWSYGLQIWQVHSKGPSEQKTIKNFGKKGTWAYAGTAQIFGTLLLRNG